MDHALLLRLDTTFQKSQGDCFSFLPLKSVPLKWVYREDGELTRRTRKRTAREESFRSVRTGSVAARCSLLCFSPHLQPQDVRARSRISLYWPSQKRVWQGRCRMAMCYGFPSEKCVRWRTHLSHDASTFLNVYK